MSEKRIADMTLDEGKSWIRNGNSRADKDARREKFFLHWLPCLRKLSADKSAESLANTNDAKLRDVATDAARKLLSFSLADDEFKQEFAAAV